MDVDKLRQFLYDKKCLLNENSTDFICRDIFFCGDHPDKQKQGHLYVSKVVEYPFVHCFFCNVRMVITDFINSVTGNKIISETIITKDELNTIQNNPNKKSRRDLRKFIIPELDLNNFKNKTEYVKTRTDNKLQIEQIPNLIFDFNKFINDNNIQLDDKDKKCIEELQYRFIGFLSNNHTKLFCRCIDSQFWMKFRKVNLQAMPYNLLDYYSIPGGSPILSDTIVLTEGTFNILGEYAYDSLGIRDKVKVYAAGQSFSYSALLKSICFFESVFKVNIIILSDDDKKEYDYKYFIKNNEHVINTIKFFYNKNPGGDFGSFPIVPYEVNIWDSKSIKNLKWKKDLSYDKKRR
jgi:hypothetical protein